MNCSLCLEKKELASPGCIHHVCADCEANVRAREGYERVPCVVRDDCDGGAVLYKNEPYAYAIERHRKMLVDTLNERVPDFDERLSTDEYKAATKELLAKTLEGYERLHNRCFLRREAGKIHYLELEEQGNEVVVVKYIIDGVVTSQTTVVCAKLAQVWSDSNGDGFFTASGCGFKVCEMGIVSGNYQPRVVGFGRPVFYRNSDLGLVFEASKDVGPYDYLTDKAQVWYKEYAVRRRKAEYEAATEAQLEKQGTRIKAIEATIETLELYESFERSGNGHLLRPLACKLEGTPLVFSEATDTHKKADRYEVSKGVFVTVSGRLALLDTGRIVRTFEVYSAVEWTINHRRFSIATTAGWVALDLDTGADCEPLREQYLRNQPVHVKGRVCICEDGIQVGVVKVV